MTDTIAAAATAPAASGVGILRLSGPEAIAVLGRVFTPRHGAPMSERPDRLLVYGALHDARGRVLDWCLATVSRAPHSYTGEDTAELQCHGSPAVLSLGLEALFEAGARQALAGEFTRRAFLNGKLDLTQVEAVADLIHARSAPAALQAAGQLGGALSSAVEEIYGMLADLMAHFGAVLDYPDEDIEPLQARQIAAALADAGGRLSRLAATYRRGRALAEGLPCAIIGRPNAGKSALFNALVGYERAIVTNVPGTTRDTVEELVTLGDVPLRLIDTAGVRDARDAVERLGVERARQAVGRAELILVLHAAGEPPCREDAEVLELAQRSGKPWIYVESKCDLVPPCAGGMGVVGEGGNPPAACLRLSAVTGQGLDGLEAAVGRLFPEQGGEYAGAVLTNARQAQAAQRARDAVERAARALEDGMPPDAALTDVEQAMQALGELTGRSVRDDVTERIFQRFCVGK